MREVLTSLTGLLAVEIQAALSWAQPMTTPSLKGMVGHYLLIEASRSQLFGQKAILQSQTFDATSSRCVTFWYHMNGNGIGTLSVVMFTTHSNTSTTLWSLSGNQQDQWIFATAPINSHTERYQIWIQGTVGTSYSGDISIDDISFKPRICAVSPQSAFPAIQTAVTTSPIPSTTAYFIPAPTVYDCDFERDYCRWQQAVDDMSNWTRTQGAGFDSAGPIYDHTLQKGPGWYIFIAPPAVSQKNDTARLVSPLITDNTPRCLSFYYFMFGASVNLLNVYVKSSGQTGLGNLVWQRKGTQGDMWVHAMIEVKPTLTYQQVSKRSTPYIAAPPAGWELTARPQSFTWLKAKNSYIILESIQDIQGSIYSGNVVAVDDITFPTVPCTALVPPSTASFSCDFESIAYPLCNFTQDTTDVFDWTLNSGGTSSTGTGPFADHTYGTLAGHYLYTESSAPRHKNDTARLISKVFNNPAGNQNCLRFYYHMRGTGIGTLNIYALAQNQLPQMPLPTWTRSADQGALWKQAEVTINLISNFQVVFEGVIGSSYLGDIAIDDITVANGPCPDTSSCDFETGLCLWTNVHDGTDKFDWLRMRGITDSQYVGPVNDHTLNTSNGFYVFMEAQPPRVAGDNARLASQVFPASPGHAYCFSFWYYMHGDQTGTLSMLILTNTSDDSLSTEAALMVIGGDIGDQWNRAKSTSRLCTQKDPSSCHITLDQLIYSKMESLLKLVILEGVVGSGYRGQIAIDDTAIIPGDCPTQPDYTGDLDVYRVQCSFDSNSICSWKQSTTDDFDWKLRSQSISIAGAGPSRDHSGAGKMYLLNGLP
ncbi:MAM and LDL-receptor class A domain-containing protein 1-like [Pomacea canaliculata]|uniref:MAM and LDL-receptor class A domain-containing protein 1-like n=1 Tax=Pomacea canaliculata TaxID=400727 RepID=UPI000D72BCB6|nr:MAM and LDL-receptor class A domain-containing protein 1-like [Pomacea canaliculata]